MTGVKGQKWGTIRPSPKKKMNIALPEEVVNEIEKIAETNSWTKSFTAAWIIEEYFK